MTATENAVLITGAARRLGAEIARSMHQSGFAVALHYRESVTDVQHLCEELNQVRPDSASVHGCDLASLDDLRILALDVVHRFPGLNALVNNASTFYPTPVDSTSETDWDHLFAVNLKAPYFLAQALTPTLRKNRGCIINLVDIYAERPLADHPVYCATKAGLVSVTRSLAQDLAPEIRVNAVAPGAILWPESGVEESTQNTLLKRVPLATTGTPADIAATVRFLTHEAAYITGQVIAVDGGRSTMP